MVGREVKLREKKPATGQRFCKLKIYTPGIRIAPGFALTVKLAKLRPGR
jgi:hypothetical protein